MEYEAPRHGNRPLQAMHPPLAGPTRFPRSLDSLCQKRYRSTMAKTAANDRAEPSRGPAERPIDWIGDSRDKLRSFPRDVRSHIGDSLYRAQMGKRAANTKVMRGFHGAGVLEVVEDHDGSTYRAVYTVRFEDVLYVLHVFQKKSRKGIETPKHELDLIKQRLKTAEDDYKERTRRGKT
mgnify:CR=1 FL=1